MPPCCAPPAVYFLWHCPWPRLSSEAPWRYQARCPVKSSGELALTTPQDGVRTFLPLRGLAALQPAITRPARWFHHNARRTGILTCCVADRKLPCVQMTVHEAKDFLVEQATQPSLDGVSLSDLEKRMMCFTESAEATEDPVQLNDTFGAQYNSAEYEAKVGRLLRRACARVRKEDPLRLRNGRRVFVSCRRAITTFSYFAAH
jgi:hypothetical protein